MEKVYFTKDLSENGLIKAFKALNIELKGKVAVKLHSGEDGNQNFLKPEYVKELVEYVNGTVVECNTAYDGARTNAKDHKELLEKHGWSKLFDIDIMDEEGDIELPIPNGKVITKNYVGKNILNYDSMLVLCHAKGHPMGGFGNCLKQLSIGCASRRGKAYIHSAGVTEDANILWDNIAKQEDFLRAMAESAGTVHEKFKGNIAYVSVVKNLSVDCDCCAVAEDPCMNDIGILAGTDPIAIDRAFLDLINKSEDPGKEHFLERVNRQKGDLIIPFAVEQGYGTDEYELVEID